MDGRSLWVLLVYFHPIAGVIVNLIYGMLYIGILICAMWIYSRYTRQPLKLKERMVDIAVSCFHTILAQYGAVIVLSIITFGLSSLDIYPFSYAGSEFPVVSAKESLANLLVVIFYLLGCMTAAFFVFRLSYRSRLDKREIRFLSRIIAIVCGSGIHLLYLLMYSLSFSWDGFNAIF